MSNTYKAIIALLAISILAGGTAIIFSSQSKNNTNPNIASSSSSVVFVSSQSSQIRSAQSSRNSSNIKTTQTSILPNPQSAQNSKCNQPDSPDLVKTEDGCFEIIWSAGDSAIFKSKDYPENVNQNFLYKSDENINILKEISKDYFKKIKLNIISEKKLIWFINSKKNNETKFNIYVGFIDNEYNNQNNLKGIVSRYDSIYSISKQQDGTWSYQFKEFIKDSNGKLINE